MPNDPEMLEEYDFSKGVRGKYAKEYAEGANVVVIDPDVAEYFPDHESVNDSLRGLVAIMKKRQQAKSTLPRKRPAPTPIGSLRRPASHIPQTRGADHCRPSGRAATDLL